jgi:putative heme-binding domain-containing protein
LVADPRLASEAIQGLANYDDPVAPDTILNNYQAFSPELRTVAINTLSSRPTYAKALLQALEAKRLSPNDISAFQARQIIALGDPATNEKLRSIWGDARQSSHEKRAMIQQLRSALAPKIASANLENGKSLFKRTCASCHVLFGEGAKIGPELTGSNRKNLDYVLENIVDPSAVVGAQFRVSVFVLSDGRVISGIVQNQNDRTIALQTPQASQVIDRRDIDEVTASDKSLMPDGLLQGMSENQIRDLVGFMMSN